MAIHKRLLKVLEDQGVRASSIDKKFGLGNGNISKGLYSGKSIKTDLLEKILNQYCSHEESLYVFFGPGVEVAAEPQESYIKQTDNLLIENNQMLKELIEEKNRLKIEKSMFNKR